jgi:hypothetical protein
VANIIAGYILLATALCWCVFLSGRPTRRDRARVRLINKRLADRYGHLARPMGAVLKPIGAIVGNVIVWGEIALVVLIILAAIFTTNEE